MAKFIKFKAYAKSEVIINVDQIVAIECPNSSDGSYRIFTTAVDSAAHGTKSVTYHVTIEEFEDKFKDL